MRSAFDQRVRDLPVLGIGVSTEYGAGSATGALDPLELRRRHPAYASFLELGVETVKGLDRDAQAWLESGAPTTYHFLDINLDEPEDFDQDWLEQVRGLVERTERGHMLLLPPILSDEAATDMAAGIVRLREAIGREVIPENPPGAVFVGELHLLDFFARVCERADTGLLLDCAHLAIFQRSRGLDPLAGFEHFPLERVVEIHVAGGTPQDSGGYAFVAPRAPNLKAVVFECERNQIDETLPGFAHIEQAVADTPFDRSRPR